MISKRGRKLGCHTDKRGTERCYWPGSLITIDRTRRCADIYRDTPLGTTHQRICLPRGSRFPSP